MNTVIHAVSGAVVQRSLLFIGQETGELFWYEDREKIVCYMDCCYFWGFDSGGMRCLQNLNKRYRNPENPARYTGFHVYLEPSYSQNCIYSTCFCCEVSGVSSSSSGNQLMSGCAFQEKWMERTDGEVKNVWKYVHETTSKHWVSPVLGKVHWHSWHPFFHHQANV